MTMVASPVATWNALPSNGSWATSRAVKVDVVVVYKIDRLTRSLMDFAKIVAVFDQPTTYRSSRLPSSLIPRRRWVG